MLSQDRRIKVVSALFVLIVCFQSSQAEGDVNKFHPCSNNSVSCPAQNIPNITDFPTNSSVRGYTTRCKQDLRISQCNYSTTLNSFNEMGKKFYNTLPVHFLPQNGSESDCMVVAYQNKSECTSKVFKSDVLSSSSLGSVILKVYPYKQHYLFTGFNITCKNIHWTVLRFRFKALGEDLSFCREFHLSPKYEFQELFYDCPSSISTKEGQTFLFEYETENEHNTESKKYLLTVPSFRDIDSSAAKNLSFYKPFVYVDISHAPARLILHWQQVPKELGVVKYKVKVYSKGDDTETLVSTVDVEGEEDSDAELTYHYSTFMSSGKFYFVVQTLNSTCDNGVCAASISPVIDIDNLVTETLLVGVVGCVILIPVFLGILYMWRRQCQPPSGDFVLPVVLIIHTPSRASHLKSVITLTEYLKKNCFINTLLDQLDIQESETKDPWAWCNDAFNRADFVMVVSSPPKCCTEEGIFRNMDIVALRFLKEKFCSRSSKPHFFSVILPYCTEKDLPEEAKNLRSFKLMKDLDKMLWYLHNGGKFPSIIDSAQSLLGPRLHGGKADLNNKGKALLTVLKEAEFDLVKVCNCKAKEGKESSSDDPEDETAEFMTKKTDLLELEEKSGIKDTFRNVSESDSQSCLLMKSDSVESPVEFSSDSVEFPARFPVLTDLNLLGEPKTLPEIAVKSNSAKNGGFSILNLPNL